jgi:hypothetical protein
MDLNTVISVLFALFIYDLIVFLINNFLTKKTDSIDSIDLKPKKSFQERLNEKINEKKP